MTDPYGHLEFCVGTEDDFWCFDYAELKDGRMRLHAVINSETGSFIEDAEVWEGLKNEAAAVARRMVDAAVQWMFDRGEPIEHDAEGWSQDADYFYRAVHAYVTGTGPAIRRAVKMKRRPLNTDNYL